MDEPDINRVEKQLSEILYKKRKEAIGYALLTVLGAPGVVVIAGLIFLMILVFIFHGVDYEYLYRMDMKGLYTLLNIFLASMIMIILKHTFSPQEEYEFDITWLVAVVFFLLLLFLTYATKMPERFPDCFAVLYAVTGFFILGLLGRVYLDLPIAEYDNKDHPFYGFILAVTGLIAASYGEFFSGSWLWIPPKPDEIRVCAWILCQLALEEDIPLHRSSSIPKRVLYLLTRLKYIQVKDDLLELTLKGRDLVIAAEN